MEKRKKVMALLTVGILAMGLFGCGEKEDSAKAEGEPEKYQLGLVAKNQTDQFTAWQANEVVAACEDEYSDKFDIEVIDGSGDNAKLISGMETFISKGVDVILVQPNDIESLIPTIQQAYKEGIPVITLSEKVDDGQSTSILSSEKDMGYLLGEKAAEVLPENANIVIIEGMAGLTAVIERTEGIK